MTGSRWLLLKTMNFHVIIQSMKNVSKAMYNKISRDTTLTSAISTMRWFECKAGIFWSKNVFFNICLEKFCFQSKVMATWNVRDDLWRTLSSCTWSFITFCHNQNAFEPFYDFLVSSIETLDSEGYISRYIQSSLKGGHHRTIDGMNDQVCLDIKKIMSRCQKNHIFRWRRK